MIVLSIKADLARKEGEKRSERAKSSHAIRRDKAKQGGALPGAGPAWLKRVGDTYEPVIGDSGDYAAQAARVWALADATGHGAHTLTRLLNEEGTPMFGTGKPWYQSRVDGILSGMEVIGYHQPREKKGRKWVPVGEPILVYPAIVPHDLYERVRNAAQVRLETHGGGKSERIANLLSGLCRCRECGQSMRMAGSTSGGYLMCGGRDRGVCTNRTAFRYPAFERSILAEFLHLAMDDNAFANKSEVIRLNSTIAERETEHRVATEKARSFLNLAAKGSEMAVEMALEAEAEAKAIGETIKALSKQRQTAKGRVDAAEHLARVQDMRERIGSDITLRRKVLQAFHAVVERATFGADGVAVVRLVKGIVELRIDLDGSVLDGKALLTLNEEHLREMGDKRVIGIARAVAQRFADNFQKGSTNWSLDAAAAA